ncbi:hypothetical protein CRG98_013201 [Punica granatum]|uniref:Integrase catalytic domain-containing protein n=1 Tax=Punica granatum TaxID=22663 RepID=A0A2I0KCY2_PUNGR|nr:hypothetical protein CRG98_013201 [Punica granatum]
MATSNQSEVVIDETKAKSKKQRESSRDPLSSFEGRMTKMEFSARPDVPRPKEFKGTRVAKDVDNFIWSMETYFRATGVEDEAVRVGMVSMYLVDVALLWWRRRCDNRSGNTVNTWEEFKAEFRQQFYPEYAEDEARAKLRRLEHKGELPEYVRQFTELMLQIPSLTDKEAFFHKSDSKEKGKPKGGGDKEKSHRSDGGKTTKSTFKDKAGSSKPKGKDERMLKCFLCDADEEKEEETRLGSLRILSSITTRKANQSKGLMFADVEIAGKAFSALVNTGASNLFISEEGAKKLGLRVERTRGRLKTVNSEEVLTCGVAKDVDIRIGQWSGKETVEVIPLDDYDFVIGMDFLDRIDALLVPFADCICVLDAKCQCVVPVKRSMGNGQKTLSAMQLKRGIQKGEVTYLAALKVDEDGGSEDDVPAKVAQVLNSFKDVMLTKLPKKLPPKREYKPGRTNAVADALSRRVELAAISRLESPWLGRIKEGLQHDAKARILLELAREGKSWQFWCEDDLVYIKGRRVYVPLYDNLRREILRECHDSKWAGHPRIHRTLALVEERYYWPQLRDDVEIFVKTCLVCQQDKTEQKSAAGLLEPLPIPERPWESVSMDFTVNLPKSKGCQTLMVVVDRFSKYATFIPAKKDCPAEEAARLFMKNVVKSESTGKSPFEIVTGQQPSTPSTMASGYKGNSLAAYKKWADKKRRHVEYSVGDCVLVKLHNILRHKDVHKGLTRRYEGPFQVLQRIGNVAYKVELPKKLKLHPVFHRMRRGRRHIRWGRMLRTDLPNIEDDRGSPKLLRFARKCVRWSLLESLGPRTF